MIKSRKKLLFVSLVALALLVAGIILGMHYFRGPDFSDSGNTGSGNEIKTSAPNSMFFDLEQPDTNNFNKDELYKGIAHSGKFSAKAFGKNTYSFSINRNVSDVGLENMKQVSMSAWIYVFPDDDPVEASLVFAAFNEKTNIAWRGIGVTGTDIPKGTWFKISKKFELDDVQFTEASRFQVYFWNNSPVDILVDDFYVVMGAQLPRTGDTIYADMTKGGFNPAINYPPYPVKYLWIEDPGKDDNVLKMAGGENYLYAGKFVSAGADDILVKGQGPGTGIYTWCPAEGRFVMAVDPLPADINAASVLLTGNFTGNREQIMIESGNGFAIYESSPAPEICSNSTKSSLKQIWSGKIGNLSSYIQLISADIDSDGNTEIIALQKDGSWIICRNNGNGWVTASIPGKIRDISSKIKISSGKFLPGPAELLLVVQEKSFDLLRFSVKDQRFVSCFKSGSGRISGVDTLKVTDEYLTGDFGNTGKPVVLRYNRDWRFDLKEIVFNDSSYQIISNIDFRGYQKDYNPKYYESLKIVPVKLPGGRSFLLLLQKNPSTGMFPDAANFYSFRKEK